MNPLYPGLARDILYKLSQRNYRYTALMKATKGAKWSPHYFRRSLKWLCKEGYVSRPEKKRGEYKITEKGHGLLKALPTPEKPSL